MNDGERSELIVIGHPSLAEWAKACDLSLDETIDALRQISHLVFSDRPALIDRELKRNYLAMQGLINLLCQLSDLQERDVFALSQRCPDRVRRFDEVLAFVITLADARATTSGSMEQVRRVRRVHQILRKEIIALFPGAS